MAVQEYEKDVLKRAARGRVRKVPRCPECISPLVLRPLFKWHDGVITLRFISPDFRFAFLENDLLTEILDLLVDHFGEETVFEIARNTEKGSAIAYASMLFLADRWWAKPFTYLVEYTFLMDYMLEMSASFLGYGAVEITSKDTSGASVIARNPYSKILLATDIEACYTVSREREITLKPDPVSVEEGIWMFYGASETGRIPGVFKKYLLETMPITRVARPCEFSRCPTCDIPDPVSRFWWDTRAGVIVHRNTGRRLILWPCYALERLLESFDEQLGGKAGELIFNKVKDYQNRSISSGGIGFTSEEKLEFLEADKKGQYALLLKHMDCLGFGHGEVDAVEEGRIRITMVNPMIPTVTSGLIAGMVEALEGHPVNVSWEESAGVTTYILEL